MSMRLLFVLACSLHGGVDAGTLLSQGRSAAVARYDPLLPGESGDDGTKEGLFGSYFNIPLVSVADGKSVVANVNMQLAITSDEDHHGLMFRKSMPDDHGMLFLYPDSHQRVLYMRNTFIDLDAGWFSPAGKLLETHKLNKLTETYRWSTSSDVQFGLEMNVGWFAQHHVEPGQVQLDLEALASSIQARGFDPSKYGLGKLTEQQSPQTATAQIDQYISSKKTGFLSTSDVLP